jgi:hypothetical protein
MTTPARIVVMGRGIMGACLPSRQKEFRICMRRTALGNTGGALFDVLIQGERRRATVPAPAAYDPDILRMRG